MATFVDGIRRWARAGIRRSEPAIGLALGGGFARGIAHLGVLRVLEERRIPIGMIAGVSAGAIVASAYASGTSIEEIAAAARTMKFKDVARWTVSLLGLAGSERMAGFLKRLLGVLEPCDVLDHPEQALAICQWIAGYFSRYKGRDRITVRWPDNDIPIDDLLIRFEAVQLSI